MKLASLAEDPASFDSRGSGLRAFAVGEDEHAVPLASVLWIVGELGGCLEVGASASDSWDVRVGASFPLDHVLLGDRDVEGEDGDRDSFREGGKFAEE